MKHSLKAIALFLLFVNVVNAQIVTADNGLTRTGSSPNHNVKLGGTLDNAATSIDFGSSNSSSNLLIKKGAANYLFIKNDGYVGIGTGSPSYKLSIAGTASKFERMIGINGTQVMYLPDQSSFRVNGYRNRSGFLN